MPWELNMVMALLYRAGFEELLLVLSECGFLCLITKTSTNSSSGVKDLYSVHSLETQD